MEGGVQRYLYMDRGICTWTEAWDEESAEAWRTEAMHVATPRGNIHRGRDHNARGRGQRDVEDQRMSEQHARMLTRAKGSSSTSTGRTHTRKLSARRRPTEFARGRERWPSGGSGSP
eukprot:168072-Pleurochrysis_carterae.AAC.1